MAVPSPDELRSLARKYGTLAELRRARARGEAIPGRHVFRTLAGEFPGALYELDRLSLEAIEQRHEALVRAAGGEPVEPWMCWMHGYHALMRAALRIKPRISRCRDAELSQDRADALARDATAHAGVAVDAAFVRALVRPPAGRIAPLVFSRLSKRYGEAPAAIRDALFPRPGARHRPAL